MRCLRHDPTAPWTPSSTSRLPVPPGDCPSPARYGPHHALNPTRVAADRLTLYAPCMSTVPVQCGAYPMTPPRHGHRAGHAGYPCHKEAARQHRGTGHTTPSNARRGKMAGLHVSPHQLHNTVRAVRPHRGMDTVQDMQAICLARRQPTTARAQPLGAACIQARCALLRPNRDPSSPGTVAGLSVLPGRILRRVHHRSFT